MYRTAIYRPVDPRFRAQGAGFFGSLGRFAKNVAKVPLSAGVGALAGTAAGIDGLGRPRRRTTRRRRVAGAGAKDIAKELAKELLKEGKKRRVVSSAIGNVAGKDAIPTKIAKAVGLGRKKGGSRKKGGARKKGGSRKKAVRVVKF